MDIELVKVFADDSRSDGNNDEYNGSIRTFANFMNFLGFEANC